MKFKIDANLPVEVADILQSAGYGASTVLEQNLGGSADEDISIICKRKNLVLITLDTDFADIRAYPQREVGISSLFEILLSRQNFQASPYDFL